MSHSPEAIAAYPDPECCVGTHCEESVYVSRMRSVFDAGRASNAPAATRDTDARFDLAIDILLNGRIDPEYKQAVFDFQDGKISVEQLRKAVQ